MKVESSDGELSVLVQVSSEQNEQHVKLIEIILNRYKYLADITGSVNQLEFPNNQVLSRNRMTNRN